MGGVQKMVLGGVVSGFLLYVLSKITERHEQDRADVAGDGGLAAGAGRRPDGFLVLLYQEDG